MTSLVEKQLNIWSIQEELAERSMHKELDYRLKVIRDQYTDQMIKEKIMVLFETDDTNIKTKNKRKKLRCSIL